jgi:iron complex transport system ATP-binding protein
MAPEPKLIDIRNATIWRGASCVFNNLNLAIDQHERVAILGPNGSGKTTLLKTLSRELYPVVQPDSHVQILGLENWNVWQLRKHIGIVSHDLQQRYRPTAAALEVVVSGFFSSIGVHGSLAGQVTSAQLAAARTALEELGIGHLEETALQHMSTGEQRRCLLARALVHRPATLILFEPTAGLDFAASFDYLKRLRSLAAKGRNMIVVTHHLNEIPRDVERVVLLKNGRIAADGLKDAVLTDKVLSRVYDADIRVAEIDGYYLAYPGKEC